MLDKKIVILFLLFLIFILGVFVGYELSLDNCILNTQTQLIPYDMLNNSSEQSLATLEAYWGSRSND